MKQQLSYKQEFPLIIDNSMLSDVKQCQKKAYWKHELGLRTIDEENYDLVAGRAFASAVARLRTAYYREGKSIEVAMDEARTALYEEIGEAKPPKYNYKTADRMAGALLQYVEKWPLDGDLKPIMIEEEVYAPLGTGSFGGKFDAVMEDANGVIWFVDEKTTSKLDDKWLSKWDLDSQTIGYLWLLLKAFPDRKIGGGLIRGIGFSAKETALVEVWINRQPWEIERWMNNTARFIQDWSKVSLWKEHRMALDWQCGRCEYAELCRNREPELFIDGHFEVKRWNPFNKSNE